MTNDYLEALERLAMPDEMHIEECKKLGIDPTEDYEFLKQALLELKEIKEANPSEALSRIEDCLYEDPYADRKDVSYENDVEYIKQSLLKAQEQEKENAELKKLLEIIKKKGFDRSIEDYDDYNIWVDYQVEQFNKAIEKNPIILNWDVFDKFTYTAEEFYLLKRWQNE